MKINRLTYLCFALVFVSAYASAADGLVRINVSNPLDFDRSDEIVSVDMSQLGDLPEEFVVRDSSGKEITHQITYDNKLIFPVSLPASSERTYQIERGRPTAADSAVVYGRLFPERLDDFAWENDVTAYRCYGPAFRESGAVGYGYDVWTKSVTFPILETRYHNELNNIHSYHRDDGTGMDVYEVGASLGAGATALIDSDTIIYPTCFESCEILDNGPLRFTVKFTMFPNSYEGKTIAEARIISLDKGALFNRAEVVYDTDLTPDGVVAGISMKEAARDAFTLNDREAFVTYEDPTDNPHSENGVIYLALLADDPDGVSAKFIPAQEKQGSTFGHACLDFTFRNKSTYTYYWGGCWNKKGIPDPAAWNRLVARKARELRTPMLVKVSRERRVVSVRGV